jgi:putative transposase
MMNFKWRHFKKEVILMMVRWYLAYPMSYRDIEKMEVERRLPVDHSTVNR